MFNWGCTLHWVTPRMLRIGANLFSVCYQWNYIYNPNVFSFFFFFFKWDKSLRKAKWVKKKTQIIIMNIFQHHSHFFFWVLYTRQNFFFSSRSFLERHQIWKGSDYSFAFQRRLENTENWRFKKITLKWLTSCWFQIRVLS